MEGEGRALSRLTAFLAAFARVFATTLLVAALAMLTTELAPGSVGERAARAAGVLPADDSAIPSELRGDLAERVARAHGLDAPFSERFAVGLARVAVGDFGRSWRTGAPVRDELLPVAARTAILIALALALALIVGAFVAALQTLARPLSRLALGAAIAAVSVTPPVWIALILLRGAGDRFGFALAVVSLAALPAAILARHGRHALAAAGSAPHATAARARGVSERRLVLVHGSRVMAGALASLFPGLVGYSIGAAMVIEKVFGIRGFGAALADAASRGDAPTLVAAVAMSAAAVATAAAISRAVGPLLDPRLGVDR